MLNDSDKETLHYLKQSSDSLKKDAAELIERLDLELSLLKRKMRNMEIRHND